MTTRLPCCVPTLLLCCVLMIGGGAGADDLRTPPGGQVAGQPFSAEPSPAPNRPVSLKVGDVAPAYDPAEWIQGEPVPAFAPGKVYLIDFTATWCGPCIRAIPHLNELHQKFEDQGLVVIGQNVLEESRDDVVDLIERSGDQLAYRVAFDDRGRTDPDGLLERWMYSAGYEGIPAAFLVNQQGRIAWIGHPGNLEETVVAAVLSGDFDLAKAAAEYEEVAADLVHVVKREPTAGSSTPVLRSQVGDASRAEVTRRWVEERRVTVERVGRIRELVAAEAWDEAEAIVDQLAGGKKASFSYLRLHLAKRDYAAAAACAAEMAKESPDTFSVQYTLTRELAYAEELNGDLLEVATAVGQRALELQKVKQANVYDALARIRFMQGDKEGALAMARQAVACAGSGRSKERFQQAVDRYEQGKLPDGALGQQLRGLDAGYGPGRKISLGLPTTPRQE